MKFPFITHQQFIHVIDTPVEKGKSYEINFFVKVTFEGPLVLAELVERDQSSQQSNLLQAQKNHKS